MESKNDTAELAQYLTFHLASEEYAITILRIKEIIEYNVVTKVPGVAPWIRGVINLRGNVVPVVDLAVKFGGTESLTTKLSCIIIVELQLNDEPLIIGIMSDSVDQVIELSGADIQPPPTFGTQFKVDYLAGMGKLGKKFALILDIDRVLSAEDLFQSVAALSLSNGDEHTVATVVETVAE